jgi:8-oxo-dGTP diphosphatase
VIEAAGGVVWRSSSKGTAKVLLVHRPRYDDWTLPKGKLEPGESAKDCARREVLEETGFECKLGDELAQTTYDDRKGRPKRVRYWAMQVVRGSFEPNHEVDDIGWFTLDQAVEQLTYKRDAKLLASLPVPAVT